MCLASICELDLRSWASTQARTMICPLHLMPVKIRLVGWIFRILQFGPPQAKTRKKRKMRIVSPPPQKIEVWEGLRPEYAENGKCGRRKRGRCRWLALWGEDAPRVSSRRQMSFLAVKNVAKFSVTKFKPIFPGEDGQKTCHLNSTFFTKQNSKFHHQELLGPLSHKP